MKKVFAFLLACAMLVLIASCEQTPSETMDSTPSETTTENSTTTETTTSPETTTILQESTTFSTPYVPRNLPSGISLGMSYDEVVSVVGDEENIFFYIDYAFYTDREGDWVILEFSKDEKFAVMKAEAYAPKEVRSSDFDAVFAGMDLFEVAEIVGIPKGTFTSGVASVYYKTDDGEIFQIRLDSDMKVKSCVKLNLS